MNRKEALKLIIDGLYEVMDQIDDINNTDETESWYCKVRDLATDIQYTLDDME